MQKYSSEIDRILRKTESARLAKQLRRSLQRPPRPGGRRAGGCKASYTIPKSQNRYKMTITSKYPNRFPEGLRKSTRARQPRVTESLSRRKCRSTRPALQGRGLRRRGAARAPRHGGGAGYGAGLVGERRGGRSGFWERGGVWGGACGESQRALRPGGGRRARPQWRAP